MAGTPGACSQVFCHPISCTPVMRYRQRYVINTSSVPPPPPTPPGSNRLRDLCFSLRCTMMDDPSGRPPAGGVARRRRERRLRAQLRHEQQTVRMVLATVTHHSFQVGTTHAGLRAQKAPPPGMRPGVLQDPAPQGRVGQHSGIGYELVLALDVPVLHMVEQPVDVRVRVDELLKKQEEEEEEVRRWRQTPLNQLTPLQRKKAFEHISKRKRKKRRLPRTSSHSSSRRARRRLRRWHAPGIMDGMDQFDSFLLGRRCSLWLQTDTSYSALLGLTVDTCIVSLLRVFHVFLRGLLGSCGRFSSCSPLCSLSLVVQSTV